MRGCEGHNDEVRTVAISPNGHLLASGSRDGQILLWKLDSNYEYQVLLDNVASVRCVAWSPDGKQLASASGDNLLRVLDWLSEYAAQVFSGHYGYVFSVSWLPDGKSIVSASGDQTIRVWNLETGAQTHILEGHTNRVNHVSVSSDGRIVASKSGEQDSTVRIWNCMNCQEIARIEEKGLNRVFPGIAFHPAFPASPLLVQATASSASGIWTTKSCWASPRQRPRSNTPAPRSSSSARVTWANRAWPCAWPKTATLEKASRVQPTA
jgi:WD40 repeat protein